ncbi:hypothetical protein D3C85_1525400 [compost metagenome]
MRSCHLSDQGIFYIGKLELPLRGIQPCEVTIYPYTNTALIASNMVKLAYERIVQISHVGMLIEVNKEFSISDDQMSWQYNHFPTLLFDRAFRSGQEV